MWAAVVDTAVPAIVLLISCRCGRCHPGIDDGTGLRPSDLDPSTVHAAAKMPRPLHFPAVRTSKESVKAISTEIGPEYGDGAVGVPGTVRAEAIAARLIVAARRLSLHANAMRAPWGKGRYGCDTTTMYRPSLGHFLSG